MANAVAYTVNFVIMPGGWFWTALRFSELLFPGILPVSAPDFPDLRNHPHRQLRSGVLAQLAEQLTLNQLVRGSNP